MYPSLVYIIEREKRERERETVVVLCFMHVVHSQKLQYIIPTYICNAMQCNIYSLFYYYFELLLLLLCWTNEL